MVEINEGAGTAIGSGAGPLFVAPSAEELNVELPNFEVESLIGQGGMGAVYRAKQPKLDRYVAIKVLPRLSGESEHSFAERFAREARAMAGLNHPNIVTVHDFGETESGYLYIVMEYVDGTDLYRVIQGGQMKVEEVLTWMVQLCGAIHYAHSQDVVHRDVKPANILINRDGQIKVGDFGLVKLVGRKLETAITRTQMAMGTPDYAAPEALEEGGEIDHRVDIYSLGVLFYELLTGKLPRGAWKPPSAYVPVQQRLDQIVVKAMQPDPDQRYQTAAQLMEAIQGVLAGEGRGVSVPAAPPAEEEERGVSGTGEVIGKEKVKGGAGSERPLAQVMFLLLMLSVGGGGLFLFLNRHEAAGTGDGVEEVRGGEEMMGAALMPGEEREPGELANALRLAGVEEGWVDVVPGLEFPRDLVSGDWRISGRALRPRSHKDWDRSRLRVPILLADSYEVALEVKYGNEVVPFGLTIPLRGGPVPLLIGEAGLPGEPRFLAVGGGAALVNERGDETRRVPVDLDAEGPHSLSLRVLNQMDQVAILVTLDGEEAGRFLGNVSEFASNGDRADRFQRQVVLGAAGDLEIRDFRVRSLPEEEWLPPPREKPVEGTGTAVREMTPAPPLTQEEAMDRQWTEAVRVRVGEIAAVFEKREQGFVLGTYEMELADLREKYNAALNRALQEDDSIPVKAAVQRELMRIRQSEAVEAVDAPEMPESVKKLRAIYRQEVAKLDEELNLALAPMLREHLEALNGLETEKMGAGEYPEGARDLLEEARGTVEGRLEGVRNFLDEREAQRKPQTGDGEVPPGTPETAPLNPGVLEVEAVR